MDALPLWTAHPGIVAISDLKSYKVKVEGEQIRHFVENKPEHDNGGKVALTFFFPNTSVTMASKYFYIMRVIPTSVTTALIQYELYRHKDASDEESKEIDDFFKPVESKDKALFNAAQKNFNSGTYVSEKLHPVNEKGVLHFKRPVKSAILEHRELEHKVGKEIWPSRKSTPSSENLDKELKFCEGLSFEDKTLLW